MFAPCTPGQHRRSRSPMGTWRPAGRTVMPLGVPAGPAQTVNLELAGIAKERGIPVIYATDAHYAFPDQYNLHDAYVAMQTNECVFSDPKDLVNGVCISISLTFRDVQYFPKTVCQRLLSNVP